MLHLSQLPQIKLEKRMAMQDDKDKPVYKSGKFILEPGKPMRFTEELVIEAPINTSTLVRAIGKCLKAYRKAGIALASGKYAAFKALAPPQFRDACHVLVLSCADGVLVRYDLAGDAEPKVRLAELGQSLEEIAPAFTEQMIHFPSDPATYAPVALGPAIASITVDAIGNATEHDRFHPMIVASTNLPPSFVLQPPGTRPPTLAALANKFEMQAHGVESPAGVDSSSSIPPDAKRFVVHSEFELPVGWRAVEIYPLLGEDYWQPVFAPLWAEIDFLASVLQAKASKTELMEMDSLAVERDRHQRTLDEFAALLDGPEEPVHQFLKKHPHLISQTFTRFDSKMPFGSSESDFVFREPPNDYLLVEIEAPKTRLFAKDGHPLRALQHAVDQTSDWARYIAENRDTVQRQLGLVGISSTPRRLVVIGRSAALTEPNRRALVQIQTDRPHLTVLTYDDLIARARANLEQLFGSLTVRVQHGQIYLRDRVSQ